MNRDGGFILLESLVSLAMVGLLTVSTLNLINTVSKAYDQSDNEGKLAEAVLKKHLETNRTPSELSLQLESSHTLENGSVWYVYSYDAEKGERREIPVFVSRGN